MSYAIYLPPTPSTPYSAEAFARLARNEDPEIWIGGLNSSSLPLPETADEVKKQLDRSSTAELRRVAVKLTGRKPKPKTGHKASSLNGRENSDDQNIDDLQILREALCFRPVSKSGVPIICKLTNKDLGVKGNVYVASGHGPWGITMSLGTGLVVSEMVRGIELSAEITGLGLG
jgi:hypothetical protein